MATKRVVGVVVILSGVTLLLVSGYIRGQVDVGEAKIEKAEKQVEHAGGLLSVTPLKGVTEGAIDSAKEKIAEGRLEAEKYTNVSSLTKIGGIILIIVGAILLFFPHRKK